MHIGMLDFAVQFRHTISQAQRSKATLMAYYYAQVLTLLCSTQISANLAALNRQEFLGFEFLWSRGDFVSM
jgi:hypothetical protein